MQNASPPSSSSAPEPSAPASSSRAAIVGPAGAASAAGSVALTRWIAVAGLVLAVAALGLWWVYMTRFDAVERDLARRIQTTDAVGAESHVMAKQAQDQALALQSKVAVLEGKLADSQSQQASLEQLYQDLSRTRDDWALAEVEQILSVASQQLQLAGNVQGALIALQNADNRLARADKPQFIPLRRVLARDVERLKTLPNVDLAGNALRLDSLVGMVDNLPLLADARPAPAPRLDARTVDRGSASGGKGPSWSERTEDAVRHGAAEVWQQFQQLIRIREIDTPDAVLLTPSQAYFVRENLKLRLLNARLALLARQESIYRADLLRASEILQQYFDTRARQTGVADALLKQIQASNTAIELPTLSESLSAVRNFKTAPAR